MSQVRWPLNAKLLPYLDLKDEYFTRADILRFFRVGDKTYKKWKKKGLLRPIIKNGDYFYRTKDIIKLIKNFPEY